MAIRNEHKKNFVALIESIQNKLCAHANTLDEKPFHEDLWQRPGGGGGRSRVLENGSVFEKAGINVSTVFGEMPTQAGAIANQNSSQGRFFWAAGVSLVLHPRNPFAPTAHANFRYFEKGDDPENLTQWWFGGGADLTPYYLFDEDARHFHQTFKEACDRHDANFYPRFKAECDQYFYLPHRGEGRGVGGIFFDNLADRGKDKLCAFIEDCGNAFAQAYFPLIAKRKDTPYSDEQRQWQKIRRGRYVEFNLVSFC